MRIKYLHKRPLDPNVKTVFMTREQTRSWSMMEPIGNPNCDTYNDPVSAALSISAMAGTYAAAGSFAAMTFAQGMIFAGSAISLAGNVTGNESLMKIGAGVALAGGITMGVEAIADGTFTGPPDGGGGAVNSGAATKSTLSNPAMANAESLGVGNQLTQEFANAPLLDMSKGTQVAYGPEFQGGIKINNVPPPANNLNTQLINNPSGGLPPSSAINSAYKNPVSTAGQKTGFMNFLNENPGPSMVIASTLAPALTSVADYASGKTAAEMDALKADAEYKRAVAKAKEDEILQEQLRRERLSDPSRYAKGIINARRTVT